MEHQSVVIEEIYQVPVAVVWEAISNNQEMKKWYFDIEEFKAEPGFQFEFYGGDEQTKFLHLCQVREVIPNKKLSYTWRYDGYGGETLVTFNLIDLEDSTKIVLTHEGFETFPDNPAFRKENFQEGWKSIVSQNLKNFLEGSGHK